MAKGLSRKQEQPKTVKLRVPRGRKVAKALSPEPVQQRVERSGERIRKQEQQKTVNLGVPRDRKASKVSSREQVQENAGRWRRQGQRIGYTSGVFDLLHAGHLDYLAEARRHCDRLVVGVNSDRSVRANKGPSRPIVPEAERAALVAGLKPVDAVFIFDELNNNANIEILKPQLYIKAGDYDAARLSSAPLVRAYGGEVLLIPVKHAVSTSERIETVIARCHARAERLPAGEPRPAIFLDRDGVICEEVDFLHEPEKLRLTPHCAQGLKLLLESRYRLVVVTNQAGIGLGYYTHEDFFSVNRAMFRALKDDGIFFDRIYYCPHNEADNCRCRKPRPGMLERALEELPILAAGSWIIGDRESDIEAGAALGFPGVRINRTPEPSRARLRAGNLLEAARAILDLR